MINTTDLLKSLISFKPVTADVNQVNKCTDYLRTYLKNNGLYTKTETLKDRKILYAATNKYKQQDFLFNAHLDVVPAEAEMFKPVIKKGWLWGRGAGDCLGNCAMIANCLIKNKDKVKAGAIFTTDEETGGDTTAYMIAKGYQGKLILIVDTGGTPDEIIIAQKGILTLKLTAKGKSAHGSTPWNGDNAIDKLINGYIQLKKVFKPVTSENQWQTTASANIIKAGTVFNRIPDRAELILDVRYTENTNPGELIKTVRNISDLSVKILARSPVVQCDAEHKTVKELVNFMETSFHKKVKLVRLNGATDARHFVKLKNPVVILGIPYKDPHGEKERVNLKSLQEYETVIQKLCEIGLPSLNN
jgi:succinyl-diaminopimelate desuccinylase